MDNREVIATHVEYWAEDFLLVEHLQKKEKDQNIYRMNANLVHVNQ